MSVNARLVRRSLGPAAALALIPAAAVAGPAEPGAGAPPPWRDLIAVKRATAAYHDVAAAEADGFVRTSECEPQKGVHFLREVADTADALVPTRPNVLVYETTSDGDLRLLGVEYASITPGTFLGHELQRSSVVPYYLLHVWVWDRDAGQDDLFAADNPRITCGS
ncbi:hypothetical protein [Streptomyces radicis]|uniref:Uncharacterized protein n=1 Tax=Streptomyces radicis TaxID=1750517 RepID=A0A3A9WI18_9ACTN|nr:hypothetical protein [Streptomyces radicis]RKN09084.1 hypothetical protein D7319_14250 [Streptomyces radicis]RKN22725.1 hypothetical protein D7318_14305 [Streptomyces radicis]